MTATATRRKKIPRGFRASFDICVTDAFITFSDAMDPADRAAAIEAMVARFRVWLESKLDDALNCREVRR